MAACQLDEGNAFSCGIHFYTRVALRERPKLCTFPYLGAGHHLLGARTPGGFLKFFNNNTMRCTRDDYPMTDVGSFWINIPLVYIAMPFSAVLAHFFGLEWGIWTALFSVLNGLGHVGFWTIFGRKYNPGLCASLLLNIPFGIYAIHYFVTNLDFSTSVYVISAIVGILAQASMMIYAFGVLLPRVKREGLLRKK